MERVEEDLRRGLKDAEVALTGRLASMTRDEARARIEASGGRVVPEPGERTAWLVVGQGGPPLGEDGRLTRSLRTARALERRGRTIRIVGEEELLRLLGLEERGADLQRLYTTQQLARILGVPSTELRKWMRHELIRPVEVVRRLCFFDFRQVATARWLARLTQRGITPRRIRRSLERIRAWYPAAEQALSQLEAFAQGDVVLRTDEGQLAEPSGQLRLSFREREELAAALPVRPPATGEEWFEAGVHAEEEGRFEEAVRAYRRALADGGPPAETLFNLGNALYALGRRDEAAGLLARAAEVDPEFVEAWNNLGNVRAELDDHASAVHAFERALALQPDYADAHFNLAETLAAGGELRRARGHWRAYLERDPVSPWADVVRERLRVTEGIGERTI